MTDLLALADRVEKLTGPDRPTDGVIWAAIQGVELLIFENPPSSGEVLSYRGALKYPGMAGVGRYTSSLDAAMTLVPEGVPIESLSWWPSVPEGYESERCCRVTIRSLDANGFAGRKQFKSEAAAPALALCAAALRARANNGSAT